MATEPNDEQSYEVSIPDPQNPGMFCTISDPMSYEDALAMARDEYGADENGMVRIVNPVSSAVGCEFIADIVEDTDEESVEDTDEESDHKPFV